jgi:peroxisome proliferator-activated receptor gamma coactivator-related protein 1
LLTYYSVQPYITLTLRFGAIQKITFHERHSDLPHDDYAFVTFLDAGAATRAIDGANRHLASDAPVYDLSFGGRRRFCRRDYMDLDGGH